MNVFLAFVSGLIIFLGAAGSVLPFLPGPPLALAGILLYAFITEFEKVGITAVAVFSVLTLLTILFDLFGPALVSRGYKSSKLGAWGAFIGTVAGFLVLGPLGILLGPFVGAFLGELLNMQTHHQALRSAWGAFVGFLLGSIFKLLVALSMLFYFIIALLK